MEGEKAEGGEMMALALSPFSSAPLLSSFLAS